MKVAIYTRVSKTAGDPVSIKEQERRCRAWAKDHSHRVVRVYSDDGVSGTKIDRPALASMFLDSGTQLFEGVIVYDLDRLARDLVVQETIIGELRKSTVELHSVNQPNLDGDDPWRVFARQIFGAAAQLNKAMVTMRLAAGRAVAKRERGHCEGQMRWGFTKKAGKIAPATKEQEAYAIMKKLRASGTSYEAIAQELERLGMPTRRPGAKWHRNTVRRILVRGNKPF